MIKLVRIDDRLVHGQVALTWTPAIGADCLIVANDKVAKDDFQKMTLGLAKPAGAKLLIKSIADTIGLLNDEKFGHYRMLVLVNSVADVERLASQVAAIRSINFGGLRMRDGARSISKAVSVTDTDVTLIKSLINKGIELEIRQVPSDNKQLLSTLI